MLEYQYHWGSCLTLFSVQATVRAVSPWQGGEEGRWRACVRRSLGTPLSTAWSESGADRYPVLCRGPTVLPMGREERTNNAVTLPLSWTAALTRASFRSYSPLSHSHKYFIKFRQQSFYESLEINLMNPFEKVLKWIFLFLGLLDLEYI